MANCFRTLPSIAWLLTILAFLFIRNFGLVDGLKSHIRYNEAIQACIWTMIKVIYASVPQTSLVQIMACCLSGAKPLPELMLEYCWLWTLENQIRWNLNLNLYISIQENAFEIVRIGPCIGRLLPQTAITYSEQVFAIKYALGFVVITFCCITFIIAVRFDLFTLILQGGFTNIRVIYDCPSVR